MTNGNWGMGAGTALLGIAVFTGGIFAGERMSLARFGVQLKGVQASLLIDRIVQEAEIKTLLTRGCITEAIGEVSNQELSDRKMLSGFVNERLDKETLAYITKRDPHFLNEIASPAGSFTNTWPACQK